LIDRRRSGESSASPGSWGLPAVVAVALVVRAAVMAPGFGRLDDPDNYLVLARSLAEGRGFAQGGRPTAYRPPLYPIVLAPLVATLGGRPAWGVAALHLAMGAGTVGLTWCAARRWGMSPARVLVASAIVACDPVLVAQARGAMTETLAALLIAAALAALAGGGPRGALLGGMALGLAALCRPSLLPGAGLTLAAALAAPPGTPAARLRRAAMLGLAVSATLLPWALRNRAAIGEPVVTTTHGGWTLALANNPVYYAEVLDGPPGAVWSGANQARWFAETAGSVAGLSEPEADRRLRSGALRFIAERPRDFARASLARLARFWALAPAGAVYSPPTRLATAAWTLPLWLALGLGLASRDAWRWPRAAAPAMILALAAVHSVYWTDMRMRAPIVPAIALLAAGARRPPKTTHADEESRGKDP
jgi:hypothetical protein